jgi:hypothetical protein
MPPLKNKAKLVGRRDNYAEQPPYWYRERLLVFVPELYDQVATKSAGHVEEALRSVVRVIEVPFVEADSRIYAPMSDFVIRKTASGGTDHTEDRIRKLIQNLSRDLGIEFDVRVFRSTFRGEGQNGFFTGTSLFVPPRDSTTSEMQRGTFSVFLYAPSDENGNRNGTEWTVRFSGEGAANPAAFFEGQDRLVFGYLQSLPVRLELVRQFRIESGHTENDPPDDAQKNQKTDLSTHFDPNRIGVLLPPTGGPGDAGLHAFFMEICDKAKAALAAPNSANGGQRTEPLSLISDTQDTWIAARDISDTADDGLIEFDATEGLLTKDADRLGYSAIMRVVPNSAYSRLRAKPDKIKSGRLEILGLIIPNPSSMRALSEVVVNFSTGDQLLPHDLAIHSRSAVIRQKPYVIPLHRNFLSVATNFGTTWEDPLPLSDRNDNLIGQNHRVQMISFRSRFELNTSSQSGLMGVIRDLQRDLPGNHFSVVWPVNPTSNLGWVGIPRQHTADADYPDDTVPVTYLRNRSIATKDQVCLDWMDSAVKIVARDNRSALSLLGYCDFWTHIIQRDYPALSDGEAFCMIPSGSDRQDAALRLAFAVQTGDTKKDTRLETNMCFRIGPLIVRYVERRMERS